MGKNRKTGDHTAHLPRRVTRQYKMHGPMNADPQELKETARDQGQDLKNVAADMKHGRAVSSFRRHKGT